MLAKRAATPERAVEIDVDDVQPVLIGYFFSGGLAPRDASIVDENVDLSMPCRQLIRDLGDARGIRYIHNDDLRVQAFRLQARAAGLGGDGVAIRDHDLRSRLCQRFRARKSDSLTGARHHGRFSVQLEFFQIHLLCSYLQVGHRRNSLRRYRLLFAHARMTSPSLSKRCRRAGSGASQTRSPAFRPNSPMARTVSVPSLPASTYRKVSLPRCSATDTVPAQPSPSLPIFRCSGRMPRVATPGSPAASPDTKFILGDPMKPATNRFAGRSYNSSGEPYCSMRPALSTTILSAIVMAST